jgi:hypothetical protein
LVCYVEEEHLTYWNYCHLIDHELANECSACR